MSFDGLLGRHVSIRKCSSHAFAFKLSACREFNPWNRRAGQYSRSRCVKRLRPRSYFVSRRIDICIHEISDPKKSSRAQSSGRMHEIQSGKRHLAREDLTKHHWITRYTSCSLRAELKNLKKRISRSEQMKHAYWWGVFRGMIAVYRVMCVPTL